MIESVSSRGAQGGWGDWVYCVVCYVGSLIAVVILGLLLLIADMKMAAYYEKKLFKKGDRWWTKD